MQMRQPRVTVIVPGYNVEAWLAETLDSVLAQTMPDFELIVVDDGSTDGTRAIAESYAARDARVRVVHQANEGISGARNTGYRVSNRSTCAVIFLDGDDLWEPHALATLLRVLNESPDAIGVYGANRFFDETGRVWPNRIEDAFGRAREGIVNGRVVSWPADAPTTFDVLVTWPAIATGGQLLIRREAMPDTPTPFEPRILSEDWLFWLLLTRHGGQLRPHWEFLLHKRERRVRLSKGPAFGRAEIVMRRKLLQQTDLTPAQRRTAWAGHWHGVRLRLVWARQSLRAKHPVEAAKQIRHFWIALTRYLRLKAEFVR
jgi:glycosyltransferase involved in cell wall biosynthesis